MSVKLIIFDLDGTLLDTLADLHCAVNHALSSFRHPLRSPEEVRSFVGNGIPMLIRRAAPASTSDRELGQLERCFSDYYSAHQSDFTRPYAGISQLLHRLRSGGCLTAVVSNKQDQYVRSLCDRFFPNLFDCRVGARENLSPKPSPDLVRLVLQELNLSASQTVYIGDSEVDLETADNCGIPCILVDWGFRSAADLRKKGASVIVSSPEEILRSLDFL